MPPTTREERWLVRGILLGEPLESICTSGPRMGGGEGVYGEGEGATQCGEMKVRRNDDGDAPCGGGSRRRRRRGVTGGAR